MQITKLSLMVSFVVGTATQAQAALLADFDGGGVPYAEGAFRSTPVNSAQIRAGGPTGNYYHLLDSAEGDSGNTLSFESPSSTAGWLSVSFTMDYSSLFVAADGFSVAFLDRAIHGDSGAVAAGANGLADVEERGQYSNSIGVGFRTFNGTNATINYNGDESADAPYALASGGWGSMEISMERDLDTNDVLVDVSTFTGTGQTGTEIPVFEDYAIAGVTMEEFRVQIAGRTGGSAMTLDLDNINLDVSVIPEPASSLLAGLACLGLIIRRRR